MQILITCGYTNIYSPLYLLKKLKFWNFIDFILRVDSQFFHLGEILPSDYLLRKQFSCFLRVSFFLSFFFFLVMHSIALNFKSYVNSHIPYFYSRKFQELHTIASLLLHKNRESSCWCFNYECCGLYDRVYLLVYFGHSNVFMDAHGYRFVLLSSCVLPRNDLTTFFCLTPSPYLWILLGRKFR